MRLRREDLRDWYPAGYEYEKELGWIAGLLALGLAGSLYFFYELYREVQSLWLYADGERFLRDDKIAASFTGLTDWYWSLWLPVFGFLLLMPFYHYFYYFRETRSIYVMRRLPGRGELAKSCAKGPLLCAAAAAVSALLLYLLYFAVYLLAVPDGMGRLV